METKHTPTPWTVEDPTGTGLVIVQANLPTYHWAFIATVDTDMDATTQIDHPVMEANAEFIVRACNAHDDLLAALTKLKDFVASLQWGQKFPGRPHAEMDAAERAIAKALPPPPLDYRIERP